MSAGCERSGAGQRDRAVMCASAAFLVALVPLRTTASTVGPLRGGFDLPLEGRGRVESRVGLYYRKPELLPTIEMVVSSSALVSPTVMTLQART
jgi:hypothetical protein